MSYLNVPRIHFAGTFQADPSTVNNNDANYDPSAPLAEKTPNPNDDSNYSVYWNPSGTHNFKFEGCTVQSVFDDGGKLSDKADEPLIGAQVLTERGDYGYPAKIVDLDPDSQTVSQIYGLQILIQAPLPDGDFASVSATMPPSAFDDLWARAQGNSNIGGIMIVGASYQATLAVDAWDNVVASPALSALQQLSPDFLSICFNVDSHQPDQQQANFTRGRIVGTIGPALPNEAPRSLPRRLASNSQAYGPVGATFDEARSVLSLDFGNFLQTDASSGNVVPVGGWPIIAVSVELSLGQGMQLPAPSLKSGAPAPAPVFAPVRIDLNAAVYQSTAGVVDVPIPATSVPQLLSSPLIVAAAGVPQGAPLAEEDSYGRYVDVDVPFLRMNPGDAATVTLWATRFGKPQPDLLLDFAVGPPGYANGLQWQIGQPGGVIGFSGADGTEAIGNALTLKTDVSGKATLAIKAGDPGLARFYTKNVGQSQIKVPGPDGQIYQITGCWAGWGGIFAAAGAPINILVFSGYAVVDKPTWTEHIEPILGDYARMYPYMKGILDLGDYDTVVDSDNAAGIQAVLQLPVEHPHHMPIVRDLSANKLQTILNWYANGTPK